jgi:KDO2-lipid IV(A) lauroyltransferase
MKRLRHRLEYGVVMAVRGLVAWLPAAGVRGLGACVGYLFYLVDGRHRRLAIRQLRAAFPVRSDQECQAIARATFEHFGRSLLVLLKFSTLDREEIAARVEFEGLDRLQAALKQGKGVLMFSGHFGYWELYALAHPLVLSPLSVVARPLDNPLLGALLERTRTATGNRIIYKRGALRRILRALEANDAVAMLIDQFAWTGDAVTIDFFGRPAATSSALAALALRTGAPLVPFFALPLADGRYRVICEHPVAPPPPGTSDPARELTQRCTDVLEMYVRRYPHLWLWMHRRWREQRRDDAPVPEMFPADAPDMTELTDVSGETES